MVQYVTMVIFAWWEVPCSMRAEWRCVLMTSGEPCVTTTGMIGMLQLPANSWDMPTLQVSATNVVVGCMLHCNFHHSEILLLSLLDTVGGIPYINAHFGAGSGPIYFTDVSCATRRSYRESSLFQCNSAPILSSDCTHSEDAGVKCEGMSIILITVFRGTITIH